MAEFTDWSDGAVGKQVFITGHDRSSDTERRYFTISGVYKSYIIGNLTGVDPRPSALFYGEIGSMTSWMPHTFFKVRPEELPKVRQALEQALEGREINILSYEEQMRAAYADSKKMRTTMAIGAVFPRGPANSTASLTSQRHPGKFPIVPCRSRGKRGFPAATRERKTSRVLLQRVLRP